MLQTAENTERMALSLLREWGDALLRLQAELPGAPTLHGGILCPCCKMIHGRCHEAAYPLLTLAEKTGEDKYLLAAKKLFRWGENMRRPDGSLKNDAKSGWRGVTVFGAIALHDALCYHGALLTPAEKAQWEQRLAQTGAWLYENLRPGKTQAYLNYYAATAAAMALLGNYFGRDAYLSRAQKLADFCFAHTSENGLLYGEGHPLDAQSEKGCYAFDIGGYNPEETLPALTRCASALGDAAAIARCRALWKAALEWMLPDGAWDDSTGTRAFKWTYWGSRTADGCQDALFYLGKTDPVFAEAAVRNLALYRRCTRDGLLFGGPDYAENGELPCVHHTFCHAKTLAGSLNGGLYDFPRAPLPADAQTGAVYYPELDVYRIALGSWRADVCGYDVFPMPGAHASGGALSLLWHKTAGPLIACGAADYTIKEPLNQQLPEDTDTHRSLCPRIEAEIAGARFAQHYDRKAKLTAEETDGGITARAAAFLCDSTGAPTDGPGECTLLYEFTEEAVVIRGQVSPAIAPAARYIIPLIGMAKMTVLQGALSAPPRRIFHLSPGFRATEYTVRPDDNGAFSLRLTPPAAALEFAGQIPK